MRKFLVFVALPILFLLQACQAASVEPAPKINVDYKPLQATAADARIDEDVVQQLQARHYSPVTLNDAFSKKLLGAYLDDLDATHSVFLASDVAYFRKHYATELDDDLKDGNLDAAFDIYNVFQQRRIQIDQWLLQKLDKGVGSLDLKKDESVTLDRKDAPWPDDVAARRALWTKQLKSEVISMHLGEKDNSDKKINKRLTERYTNELKQLRQAEPMDVVSAYMDAYTHSYDPHTDYFSPRRSEDFAIGMNLSLQGIGAQLRSRNGYPELVRLIPGGPAAKSGKLKPTDRIIAVGQGKQGKLVDVVGMRLDEAVQLIRGKKGSTVRLQITSADGGSTRTISLVRDTIKLKDRAASKQIIPIQRDGKTVKVGLIRLPSFYNGTTRDVRKLLGELKQQDVAGVIIDLRNNGGGALREVTRLTGLFTPHAPVVQIRDADGDTQSLGNNNHQAFYNGPLMVMVNRLSASASEIFAGAIQDYGRGLIVGNQTFGKGTVQTLLPLQKGRIKITQAKFYRITGASTQDRGVTPGITYPALVNPKDIGESALPNALPWDKIKSVPHPYSNALHKILGGLSKRHDKRIKTDPDFRYRVARIELARKRSQRKSLSLNLAKRRAEQEQYQDQVLKLVNTKRKADGEKPFDDFAAFEDSDAAKSPQQQATSQAPADEKPDAYQKETARILLDARALLNAPSSGTI